jgi:S1-C subfamily serine protease
VGYPLLVLTAWHLVRPRGITANQPLIFIKTYDNQHALMDIVRADTPRDLVLLKSILPQKKSGPAVSIATNLPTLGSAVWAIGNPKGVARNISTGVLGQVIAIHASGLKAIFYRTDTATHYGSSGGGLFNNDGKLIGIMSLRGHYRDQAIPLVRHPVPGSAKAVALPHIHNILKGI